MHRYSQRTGLWTHGSDVWSGYSGHGIGRNDPTQQSTENVGPIPTGRWRIVGPPVNTASHGPFVLALHPEPGTDTHGRSGFLLHGDSIRAPGQASEGCIILAHQARQSIWSTGDRELEVVSGDEPAEATT